nr:PREDICTED: solute carrier family 23 member 3 [Lepisosteus oculatus]
MAICSFSPVFVTDKEKTRVESRTSGFRVDQRPPWFLNICLAVQHVLIQSSLLVLVHSLLQQHLLEEKRARIQSTYHLMATSLFSSGISTLLQTTLGTRLPLIQAPSMEFLIPAIILTSQEEGHHHGNGSEVTCSGPWCGTKEDTITWNKPIRELQGAVVAAGLVQVLLGISGLSGLILWHCGPLVIAPMLCIIGFSIYKEAALLCSSHWGIATLIVLLIVILSQHLHDCFFPAWGTCVPEESPKPSYYPACRMLSVLLPLLCVWIIFVPLEITGVYPLKHPEELSQLSRPINLTYQVPWLRLPIPGGGDLPLLTPRCITAGIAAALSAAISSQGCYMVTARLLEAPPPPPGACNRGLASEGLGSIIAGMLGSVGGTSTSVPNACALGLNQCGSRQTIQLSALLCVCLGVSPKLTQMLTTIPLAVHGGVLSVTYAIAVATGITYFQYTHMDSGRNIFNIGFTVFMALLAPHWFNRNPSIISTGVSSLDVFIQSLLTMPVFLVGVLAFLLDNTVSGTPVERGLHAGVTGKVFKGAEALEAGIVTELY